MHSTYLHTLERIMTMLTLITSCISLVLLSPAFIVSANNNVAKMINSPPCHFPAIYNFGDSNSATGGSAASPSGQTFFGKPNGRASDGRLIIDFIAEHLGLAYLSSNIDAQGSGYQHGVNFAVGGASIMKPSDSWLANGVNPVSLEIQVQQFTQLKLGSNDLYQALFMLDIGQNDVSAGIKTLSYEQQLAAIPAIVSQLVSQIRVLYQRGAKTFWIHNTGPIGCLAIAKAKVSNPPSPGYLDEIGCVKTQNDVAFELNKQMKNEILNLRREFSDAALIYVDMYRAKYELIANAKNQGFDDPFGICCGYHGMGYDVYCGNKGYVNGNEVFAGSCSNPSRVISWDGVHYTEAANKWIANRIANGALSDPPVPISTACYKQM